MLLLSERIGAHIQHRTALRDFPKQTLHFIVLQHLCIAGAECGLKSLTHLPPLCAIIGIPHQRWKVLSAQLWFLFHSLPDMLTMAKALETRSIWQKSCQHTQKELLYPKNSTDVLAEVPGKSVLANPLQCRQDLLFVFPSFHYRAPVSSFEAPRSSYTTSQLHGESQTFCPPPCCVPQQRGAACTQEDLLPPSVLPEPRPGLAAQGRNASKTSVWLPSTGESLGSSASLPVTLSNRL